ncbi:succinylglutamate desuccinylase/aspartoacylase family protein [Pseudomonas sp. YuFO8]|uniref:succinylglutamate desuccinylase/aspartoacylase family protein n=1 Tax=Pseudomonas sp. YuFO8 TaxID=3095361 RepID=UPI002B246B7D|nr:succinylglutamate desuccinylase/aspartoacylase family protein [Pseudomonas sp. YuFO8]MEB2623763.1 M14 family metallopeptidase [Pseudomonas sp. YuFO8]
MSIETRFTDLPPLGPGNTVRLHNHEFTGNGSSRSAYIQAGLHADEHPGLLVIQHLQELLVELHQQNRILGRIVLCPFANPVGMTQNVLGFWTGRFNLANGENFNRNFPDLLPVLDAQLNDHACEKLTPTQRLVHAVAALSPADTVSAVRQTLLGEALQHDVVLDLHCDTAGVLHLYANDAQRDQALTLAECMNIEIVFLEKSAGGQPFDESCNRPWDWLIEKGLRSIEERPFAASIELRGQADVDDQLARLDALGILDFLALEGLIRLDSPVEAKCIPKVYPLEGASHLPSPGHGLLVWKKRVGEAVSKGELIGELVPIDAAIGAHRLPILSDVDGVITVQPLFKLVRAGQRVALLAGIEPLPNRRAGQLLNHF